MKWSLFLLGAEGAVLVTSNVEKKFTAPSVEKKSTVGAGDSMVAGIVFALTSGYSVETAVQFGVACGTAATMNSGTELCKREDVDKLVAIMKAAKESVEN